MRAAAALLCLLVLAPALAGCAQDDADTDPAPAPQTGGARVRASGLPPPPLPQTDAGGAVLDPLAPGPLATLRADYDFGIMLAQAPNSVPPQYPVAVRGELTVPDRQRLCGLGGLGEPVKPAALLLALPALLAGCLGGGETATPPATGQIDGAVVDHLLHPFADQPVRLVQLDREDRTSRLGGFTFREVPVGFYTVTTVVDGRSATQVVDVEADKVTRVILQVLPAEAAGPWFVADGFETPAVTAQPGVECGACSWSLDLARGDRPVEAILQAQWDPVLPVVGAEKDRLVVTVTDDQGFQLFSGLVASPATLRIDGADIAPDARSLHVSVRFGPEFTPRADFTMHSVLTYYYGASHDQMFSA